MKCHGGVNRIRQMIRIYQQEYAAIRTGYSHEVYDGLIKAEQCVSRIKIKYPPKTGKERPRKR